MGEKLKINMISFSGGRTSAYMLIKLLQMEEYKDSIICFANTGKEKEQTLLFVKQCDEYIQNKFNKKINWLEYCKYNKWKWVTYETASRHGEPFIDLVIKRKMVPNIVSRFCTQELKIRVIRDFMKSWAYKTWTNIVGIRYDEPSRYHNLINDTSNRWDNECPLYKMKVTEPQVLAYWDLMPFNAI